MDTNLEETTKTSEQDVSTIVATDTKTDTKGKMTAEELKISGDQIIYKF
jgi:hypothetical protein